MGSASRSGHAAPTKSIALMYRFEIGGYQIIPFLKLTHAQTGSAGFGV